METRVLVLSFGLAGVIGVGGVTAGQHEGHQAGTAATLSAAQVMQCRQVQPAITEVLTAALKRLEEARLTNSAAAMRDAAEDVQAALVDVRTQLAPYGEMEPATAQAGVTMPNAQTSAPPRPPGSSVTQPGTSAPAPASADSHAAHATPAAPQTSAVRATAAASAPQPAAQQRPAEAAALDSHAGHAMPAAPATRTPSASTPRPSAAESPAAGEGAHAAHATPSDSSPQTTPSAAARTSAAAPPTNIAELTCQNAVEPRTAPRMLYQGRMYYFCSEDRRAEFAKDPAKVVTAPPQAAAPNAH